MPLVLTLRFVSTEPDERQWGGGGTGPQRCRHSFPLKHSSHRSRAGRPGGNPSCWCVSWLRGRPSGSGIEKIYPVTESFVRAGGLMMLCTNAGFLDRFDSIPGFPHEPARTVWESALEIDGLRVASLDWLRNMKQAAGRPKDLLDLENLPDPPQRAREIFGRFAVAPLVAAPEPAPYSGVVGLLDLYPLRHPM